MGYTHWWKPSYNMIYLIRNLRFHHENGWFHHFNQLKWCVWTKNVLGIWLDFHQIWHTWDLTNDISWSTIIKPLLTIINHILTIVRHYTSIIPYNNGCPTNCSKGTVFFHRLINPCPKIHLSCIIHHLVNHVPLCINLIHCCPYNG